MDVRLLFGLSALASLVSSVVVAQLYVWPRLRTMERRDALLLLIAPHLFLRFIGLSFLIPGVVSQPLPPAFAVSAAYGDLVAGRSRDNSDPRSLDPRLRGRSVCVGLQHLGSRRPPLCDLPGPTARHPTRLIRRHVLHSHRDRSTPARNAFSHLSPPVPVRGVRRLCQNGSKGPDAGQLHIVRTTRNRALPLSMRA
jgi:hypothetical protein